MKKSYFLNVFSLPVIIIAALMIACTGRTSKESKGMVSDENHGGLTLPEGFSAFVVADTVGYGRHIAVRQNGDIYLALRSIKNEGAIAALRDTNNDGRADIIRYFSDITGTGIHIHKGYLYFGSDTAIVRYKMHDGALLPDAKPEVIAAGFIKNRQHASKPFAFDDEGHIYVNVGAPANACQEEMRTPGSPGMDPCPLLERAGGIWQFKDDLPGQDQVKDGHRYATGLRNCVAIEWNYYDSHLYVVQHGRDQLSQFFPEYYDEDEGVNLPAEEFFVLEDGDDCGWPYCYFDPFKNKKVLAPEYGGDGEITGRCEQKKDPILGFPAHTAPNDLIFYTGKMFPEKYRNGAFIAFHGSWNRAPQEQEGYYVVFVPFANGKPTGEWEIFANGFAGIEPLMSPSDAKYRPCGLAQGPDGSLYISDSQKGRIWRVIYGS